LTSTATVAARITRAKKTLAAANVPFEVPDRSEYPQRQSAVLSVIYLIYNEGYSASFGQRWVRDELCSEALRLGRILAALVPDEAEVQGLVSLMEFQSSRFAARTDAEGRPILLEDQNRAKWDRAQIQRGVAALERAANALQRKGVGWGPYALQAALAECHAVAPTAADTDWARIVLLYDGLRQVAPSPVVELNRAVAVAMADPSTGPASALEIVDNIDGLGASYLLPSVRGELLARLGRSAGAAAEFDRAASMTDNEREREVLVGKAARARNRQTKTISPTANCLSTSCGVSAGGPSPGSSWLENNCTATALVASSSGVSGIRRARFHGTAASSGVAQRHIETGYSTSFAPVSCDTVAAALAVASWSGGPSPRHVEAHHVPAGHSSRISRRACTTRPSFSLTFPSGSPRNQGLGMPRRIVAARSSSRRCSASSARVCTGRRG
jgi:hypothetical protein